MKIDYSKSLRTLVCNDAMSKSVGFSFPLPDGDSLGVVLENVVGLPIALVKESLATELVEVADGLDGVKADDIIIYRNDDDQSQFGSFETLPDEKSFAAGFKDGFKPTNANNRQQGTPSNRRFPRLEASPGPTGN